MRINIKAIVGCKCPRCGSGKMFPYKAYDLRRFYKMESHCPVCSYPFFPELGFYTGAMYFSYAINVFLIILLGTLFTLWLGLNNFIVIILLISIPSILLSPVIFRISRSLMLNLFGKLN